MPGQDHAPGSGVYGNSDSWVQGQEEWIKQHGSENTVTPKGESRMESVDAELDSDFE